MTPTETVDFVELVSALWPQQRMEDATPDAWFDAGLKDVDPYDAKEAATRLVATKVFISLAEILTEVKAIRNRRLERIPLPAPNPEAGPRDYQAEFQRELKRIADGWSPPNAITSGGGTGPTRAYVEARGDDPHRELRVAAIITSCPHCKAVPGERCVDAADQPLTKVPAHDARLVAAGLAEWTKVHGQTRAELVPAETGQAK